MQHVKCGVTLVSTLLVSTALSCSKQSPPYDRLCRIYEQYSKEPMTSERMVDLAEKVEREIPEITADFSMLANVDYTQRYDTLKSLARQNTHRDDWECDAVRKVYTPPPQ